MNAISMVRPMRPLEVRTRLANPPPTLVAKYPRKEREFFTDYANYVLGLFNNPEVQQRLHLLVEAERIQISKTIDLRVMLFPARPLHGLPRNVLHGSYNHDIAQISIYPLKLKRDWIRREGFNLFKSNPIELTETKIHVLQQVFESAVCTLIHEMLHVKLENRHLARYVEEAFVRKLEGKCSKEWIEAFPDTFAIDQLRQMRLDE